jgi:hypothetical protein
MKKGFVDGDRADVANHQAAIVADPNEGKVDFPASPVATRRSANQAVGSLAQAFSSARYSGGTSLVPIGPRSEMLAADCWVVVE